MISFPGSVVKNVPAKQETRVWFLGQEDPLEKKTATHFSILAWKIPYTEESGRPQSMRLQKVRYNWKTEHSQRILTYRLRIVCMLCMYVMSACMSSCRLAKLQLDKFCTKLFIRKTFALLFLWKHNFFKS